MGRAIGAVVVGYITMFVVVFVSFSIAYLAMGAERAFQPGSYGVSTLWLVVSFVLSFVAALAGGRVCARLAASVKPVRVLAVLVVVLGLAMAIPALNAPTDPAVAERGGDVENLEAMQKAQQPDWVRLTVPFVGAVGVLLAGRRGAPGGT